MSVSSSIRQITAFLMLGLAAMLVITFSLPRLAASIQFLPVDRGISAYYKSNGKQQPDSASLLAQSELAIEEFDRYTYHSAMSLLYFVEATSPGASLYERRRKLDLSLAEARVSLAAAPMQPELWLRIVQAGFMVFLPASELVQNYQMAIWSGRVEPTHLLQRLQTGLALQGNLDDDGLNLVRDQALLAWNLKKPEVSRAIRSGRINRAKLELLLRESHPDVVADMEQVLGPVTP